MKAEIVMIGTELLLGQIVDTNAAHMGQALADNGILLYQKTTVGDNRERIVRVLEQALERADVVLTSGGIGPTEDDLTREAIADLLNRPLEFNQDAYDHIAELFRRFGRPMPANNNKQAMAPRGAKLIHNPNGTAPGLIVEDDRGTIISMPGVPRELYAMLGESVIPYLKERFGIRGQLRSKVLKVCGVGESRVDELIGDLIVSSSNPTIGVLASFEAVRIRITAHADSPEEADALISKSEAAVRERLPNMVMGVDNDTLEQVVEKLLAKRGWTLAVGETDTGGMVGQRLTAAGSICFVGSLVLPRGTFRGGDPEKTANNFAESVRAQYKAICGLGLLYLPKEERTVCAFISPTITKVWDMRFPGVDDRRQTRISVGALEQVRRLLTDV